MNVETGAEAAQFTGKEYIIGIAVAVLQASMAHLLKDPSGGRHTRLRREVGGTQFRRRDRNFGTLCIL
jgi:hypothetical protein